MNTNCYSPETPNLGHHRRFFEPCDLEIWWMTFKNNRAPLLCYFKLCAAFRSHWWIQTGVKSPETPNLGQIRHFLESCDLEIWQMTFKTIRHLFYATSSFLHHFVAIGEFKLELESGNAQSGSNSTLLELGDREIWRMTFKNNRAPLLCYFKLCAAFRSHWWIQTGVRVRKRPIWVKFDAF